MMGGAKHMPNLVYDMVKLQNVDVALYLHTKDPPSKDEWTGMITWMDKYALEMGGLSRLRVLVVVEGGGPNPAQREELRKLYEKHKVQVKSAILTSSSLTRGV